MLFRRKPTPKTTRTPEFRTRLGLSGLENRELFAAGLTAALKSPITAVPVQVKTAAPVAAAKPTEATTAIQAATPALAAPLALKPVALKPVAVTPVAVKNVGVLTDKALTGPMVAVPPLTQSTPFDPPPPPAGVKQPLTGGPGVTMPTALPTALIVRPGTPGSGTGTETLGNGTNLSTLFGPDVDAIVGTPPNPTMGGLPSTFGTPIDLTSNPRTAQASTARDTLNNWGSSVGSGAAIGALAFGVIGAVVGGAGGSVAGPAGTVAGGIGGAIKGAETGAVVGGIFGGLVGAVIEAASSDETDGTRAEAEPKPAEPKAAEPKSSDPKGDPKPAEPKPATESDTGDAGTPPGGTTSSTPNPMDDTDGTANSAITVGLQPSQLGNGPAGANAAKLPGGDAGKGAVNIDKLVTGSVVKSQSVVNPNPNATPMPVGTGTPPANPLLGGHQTEGMGVQPAAVKPGAKPGVTPGGILPGGTGPAGGR